MNPREIDVHIEELVLHGFAPGTRWDLADALQGELQRLITERGIPAGWQTSPERIDARAASLNPQARAPVTGGEIARAIYDGGTPR